MARLDARAGAWMVEGTLRPGFVGVGERVSCCWGFEDLPEKSSAVTPAPVAALAAAMTARVALDMAECPLDLPR